MFVYQGAFQFELWTAKKTPIDVMRKVVLNALGSCLSEDLNIIGKQTDDRDKTAENI
jgi:hypothetical protein